jgi:hypothetical protein
MYLDRLLGRRKTNLSTVFAGQNVGVKEISDKVWLVSFMKYDLGFFDQELGTVTSAENPFGAKGFCLCARTGPETRLPAGRELNVARISRNFKIFLRRTIELPSN